MALEFLRRAIFEETRALKTPKTDVLARTFYIVLSPSMGHLQDWYHKWFPDPDEAIRHIHPWYITASGDDDTELKKKLKSMFLGAFSADITNKLINKGYRLLNTATQIILIGDLTEDGFVQYQESVHAIFRAIVNEYGNHEAPVYFTGVFLCRRIIKGDDGSYETKSCGCISDQLKSKDQLDRLFLIDIANASGVVVSEEQDMHFLVGQLLYNLSKKPLEFSEAKNYAAFGEWLHRVRPCDNKCSGFSGISILNPVDQMLETLLIAKGGEVLQSAFLGEFDDSKVDFYTKSLINNTHLNSLEVFSKMLKENKTAPLIDPFRNIESVKSALQMDEPDVFATYIDSLDAHLAGDAAENRRIMDSLAQLLLDKFRYELFEHVNAAIANETGGLLIAEKSLAQLEGIIAAMIPEKKPDQPFPDISNLILKLVEICKKGPRKLSVIVRGALLCLMTGAGMLSSKVMFDLPFVVFPLTAVLAAASITIYWYGSKSQVERRVSDIWQNLITKWNILMGKEYSETFANFLPQYISMIDALSENVETSKKRLQEVVDIFMSQYVAALPVHSAFWLYAVNSREDLMRNLPLVQANIREAAAAYLKEERPLALWNRTAPPNSSELNEWEWTLGETIGLRLIPSAKRIVDLSVSQLLNDSPVQTKAFLELLKGSAQPFLMVKPGTPACHSQATVEMPDEASDELYKKIELAVSGAFQGMDRKRSMSPYRISLFSFAENIDMGSMKAGG